MSWRASGSTVTTTSTISPSIAQKCSENLQKKINRSSFFTFWFREIRESCFCRWPTPPQKKVAKNHLTRPRLATAFRAPPASSFEQRCAAQTPATWRWLHTENGDGLNPRKMVMLGMVYHWVYYTNGKMLRKWGLNKIYLGRKPPAPHTNRMWNNRVRGMFSKRQWGFQ